MAPPCSSDALNLGSLHIEVRPDTAVQVVSHSHCLGWGCGIGRQKGDQGMGERGHGTMFEFSFLILFSNLEFELYVAHAGGI